MENYPGTTYLAAKQFCILVSSPETGEILHFKPCLLDPLINLEINLALE